MKQKKFAYTATVEIDGEEHTRGINEVTILIDPYNSGFSSDGEHSWSVAGMEGISTEDPGMDDELSGEGWLTSDPEIYFDTDSEEVVIEGMTKFGDDVETRIPVDAANLVWQTDIDKYRNRNRHEWTEYFDDDRVFIGPPEIDILQTREGEEEEEADVDPIREVLEEFVEARDDFAFSVPGGQIEGTGEMSGAWVNYEIDSLQFYFGFVSSTIQNPDPENLIVTDDPYELKESNGLPGAFEGHKSFSDEPVLVYNGEDTISVIG